MLDKLKEMGKSSLDSLTGMLKGIEGEKPQEMPFSDFDIRIVEVFGRTTAGKVLLDELKEFYFNAWNNPGNYKNAGFDSYASYLMYLEGQRSVIHQINYTLTNFAAYNEGKLNGR